MKFDSIERKSTTYAPMALSRWTSLALVQELLAHRGPHPLDWTLLFLPGFTLIAVNPQSIRFLFHHLYTTLPTTPKVTWAFLSVAQCHMDQESPSHEAGLLVQNESNLVIIIPRIILHAMRLKIHLTKWMPHSIPQQRRWVNEGWKGVLSDPRWTTCTVPKKGRGLVHRVSADRMIVGGALVGKVDHKCMLMMPWRKGRKRWRGRCGGWCWRTAVDEALASRLAQRTPPLVQNACSFHLDFISYL